MQTLSSLKHQRERDRERLIILKKVSSAQGSNSLCHVTVTWHFTMFFPFGVGVARWSKIQEHLSQISGIAFKHPLEKLCFLLILLLRFLHSYYQNHVLLKEFAPICDLLQRWYIFTYSFIKWQCYTFLLGLEEGIISQSSDNYHSPPPSYGFRGSRICWIATLGPTWTSSCGK